MGGGSTRGAMASAMIEASRRDAEPSDDELSDASHVGEFEESESSISSLPDDDDDTDVRRRAPVKKAVAKKAAKSDTAAADGGGKCVTGGGVFHMRPLPGPKPFACDICANSFQQKKSLYRHIKEVHKLKLIFVDGDGM